MSTTEYHLPHSPTALYTASIASGSNGNCYYIGNDHDAVLIDVGISCGELEKRMQRMGLSLEKVKAIFISHEHTDHIKGLTIVANKYQIPVFISPGTFASCRLAIPSRLLHLLRPNYTVYVGSLEVISFHKIHDAADPQSFLIRQNELTVGVFTDIGAISDSLIYHFQQCNVVFLETNYDEQMLEKGRYPYFLKQRIKSGYGHLSNLQAFDLYRYYKNPNLKLVYLCHLSRDNNDPQLVLDLFKSQSIDSHLVLAGRDSETGVYRMINKPTINLKTEDKSTSYIDEVITIYQSCTIRWSLQSV